MRKRLIRKFTKAKEGSLGYTLTELLVVIGIIAIVCAIAIPSIIAISRALKFKQRNDYAKSVFLAAQQNLTEMRSDGGLAPLQGTDQEVNSPLIPKGHSGFPEEDWSDEYVYTASNLGITNAQRDTYDLVLPVGSIDGTLREQQVIIEYNPITGNVYAVFYSEEEDQDILALYQSGSLPRDEAARKEIMLGYYNGSGLSSSEIELEKSVAEIEFTNGEEGIVTVKVPMPSLYFGKYNAFVEGLKVTLSVVGEESNNGFDVVIKEQGNVASNCSLDVDGKTVLITYVLDSLKDYGSFANLSAAGTVVDNSGNVSRAGSTARVTELKSAAFTDKILPGENVTLLAEVDFTRSGSNPAVSIEDGILAGVNPMFDFLDNSGTSDGKYTLAVANGRNLQNLNALHPSIADQVEAVIFTSDINWNNTVSYYNRNYGSVPGSEAAAAEDGAEEDEEEIDNSVALRVYSNSLAEAPARALPYFVPIHNEKLFGTAYFVTDAGKYTDLWQIIQGIFNGTLGQNRSGVPVLSDSLDMKTGEGLTHATIHGNSHKVYNINIDTTKYCTGKDYYAGNMNADIDRFTGLFGYVNTAINDLYVVNPIVKGYSFQEDASGKPNNPATGALLGAGGYNTQIRNCGVYLENINWNKANLQDYNADAEQTWYGVSGEGAVGGLVGYCKSHRTVTGNYQQADDDYLAFSNCFAAVDVSGNMRSSATVGKKSYDFGYTNGVGGFIGNSQLTNFYKCYASGNVRGYYAARSGNYSDSLTQLLGLYYSGRTSYGIGGFVGSSHGTRYTNCFSTGAARSATGDISVGGFVGVMCYDETFAYGLNAQGSTTVAQHTVFENCYALGAGKNKSFEGVEGFSGTNARIDLDYNNVKAYNVGDYYRLLAPYYLEHYTAANMANRMPHYQTHYIFKDSYYLSQPDAYIDDSNGQSNRCASPIQYSELLALMTRSEADLLAALKTEPLDYQVFSAVLNLVFTEPQKAFNALLELLGEEIYKAIFNGKVDINYNIYFRLADKMKIDGMETAYLNAYKEAYTTGWTTRPHTHYYGDAAGKVYPFPMISGMDYYGDWPSEVLSAGIAYYEEYQAAGESTLGYYLDRQDTAGLKNDGTFQIVSDGYAIMTGSGDTTPVVKIGNNTIDVTKMTPVTLMDAEGQKKQTFTPWHLDMDQVKAAVNDQNGTYGSSFYAEVEVKVGNESYTLYMNPNVAISQVNDSYSSVEDVPLPDSVKIRTARQFAALSSMDSFLNMNYVQQLNIDAATYYTNVPPLSPIGTKDIPFTGSYDGNGGYVEQAILKGFAPVVSEETAGYFGVIGEGGSVSNLALEMNGATVSGTKNAGILAGISNGDIINVKLNTSGAVTLTASENAGLLVGKTGGSVISCAVTTAGSVPYVNAPNAGGVIGYAENAEILDSKAALVTGFSAGGTNAGGFLGSAKDSKIQNITVTGFKRQDVDQKDNLTLTADHAGGFAGMVSGGSITTVDVALTMENENSKAGGYMGGAVGKAEGGTYVDISTTIPYLGNVIGDTAGGMFGSVTAATVRNSDVLLNHRITGTTNAGGFAGIVGTGDELIENTFVTVNSGIVGSEGRAAGFAVEFGGKANGVGVKLGSYTSENAPNTSGAVFGATEVAGFACTVTGQVNSGAVMGNGQICIAGLDGTTTAAADGKAAGFAITLGGDGRIAASSVSPAMGNQPGDYKGNSNVNLKVKGKNAVGFVLDVTTEVGADSAGIDGSYALCKLEGNNTTTYGFVGTNTGRIDGSMANVTIPVGAYTFIGSNTGMVSNCYGWFGEATANGSPDATIDFTKYPGHDGETGKYISSYFIDIKLNEGLSEGAATARLFDNKGAKSDVKASKVRDSLELLNPSETGATKEWRMGGTQVSCPYSGELAAEGYPYPELRSHYGNWLIPPQYAYGVAYYEVYAPATQDGAATYKFHVVDLSVPADGAAVESKKLNHSDTFDTNGTITDAGYVLFCEQEATPFKNGIQGTENTKLPAPKTLFSDTYGTYKFYDFSDKVDGEITVNGTRGLSAALVRYYADAIAVGTEMGAEPAFAEDYQFNIRTEKQLANVGKKADESFIQTHGISGSGFTAIDNFTGSYDGNSMNITMAAGTTWMTNMNGTVTGVDLDITGDLTAPVFGNIGKGKSVTLNDLDVAAVKTEGAVVGAVDGSFTCPTVNAGAVETKLFGDVSKDGSVTVGSELTVGAVTGKVFANVAGVANVGRMTTGAVGTAAAEGKEAVNGQIFGDVSGSVTAAGISTGGNAVNGQVFGAVSGTVNPGAITTGAVNGQVFGDITSNGSTEAPNSITVTSITVGDVNGKVFGNVGATATVNGAISTGAVGKAKTESTEAVNGQIFGNISATVTTGNITVTSLTGKLAGVISGTLTGGESGSNVNIGTSEARKDLSQNLVGNVNGSFANYSIHAANVTASVIPSVGGDGMVAGVSLNANTATMSTPVLVADNDGSLSGCSVNVGTVTADNVTGPYGVLTNEVAEGEGIEGATVAVDSLTVTNATGNVGILAGQNAGTIDSSTVQAKTEGGTASVTLGGSTVGGLVGVNSSKLTGNTVTVGTMSVSGTTVGGLVGANTGSISSISGTNGVSAAISYTGNGGVTIGGIVGEMTGGTLTSTRTDAMASGSIVPVNAVSGTNNIGGAIGEITGGSVGNTDTTVTTAVTVDGKWGTVDTTDKTFGSSGITNYGPVGMFVGKAGNVNLTNCTSTAANTKYQFLGHATMAEPVPVDAGSWYSDVKSTDALTAYSDWDKNTDGSYNAKVGELVAVMKQDKTTSNKVATELVNCKFQLNGATKLQTYGADTYFYSEGKTPQTSYSIIRQFVTATYNNQSEELSSKKYSAEPTETGKYYLENGVYYPVSIKYVENSYYGYVYSREFQVVETGNESNVLTTLEANRKGSILTGVYYTASINLHSFAAPMLDGKYLAINSDGKMLNSSGTPLDIPMGDVIDVRKNLGYVWNAAGLKITNAGDQVAYDITSKITLSDNPVMVYAVGDLTFQLYPVNEGTADYLLYTFTYQNNPEYQRQFITMEDVTKTMAVVEEETVPQITEGPKETTTPAGEAGGEVLGTEG